MSEKNKPFTVNDRRHFTPDGETRESRETVREESRESLKNAKVSEEFSQTWKEQPSSTGPIDFAGFLLSLGAQASLLLHETHGSSEDPPPQLEGVRSIISILEMLKDKTDGKRTSEEEQVLSGLLYELRMGYITKARVSSV